MPLPGTWMAIDVKRQHDVLHSSLHSSSHPSIMRYAPSSLLCASQGLRIACLCRNLYNNELTGTLPRVLSTLTSLTYLCVTGAIHWLFSIQVDAHMGLESRSAFMATISYKKTWILRLPFSCGGHVLDTIGRLTYLYWNTCQPWTTTNCMSISPPTTIRTTGTTGHVHNEQSPWT